MPISQQILDRLSQNDVTLTHLNLSRQYPSLTDTDIEQLANVLQNNTVVQSIILCENEVGNAGAEMLATGLLNNPNLKDLDLSVNNIENQGLLALLTIPSLSRLDVGANNVDSNVVQKILSNKKLVFLIIDDNKIEEKESLQVEQHIQQNLREKIKRSLEELISMAKLLPQQDILPLRNKLESELLSMASLTKEATFFKPITVHQ